MADDRTLAKLLELRSTNDSKVPLSVQWKCCVELWNRWRDTAFSTLESRELAESPEYRADLSGADLAGAELAYIDFWRATLDGADLEGANLRSADLRGASLVGTRLAKANLANANLGERADLREADLQGAKLENAVLVGTDLTGANLEGCRIYGISAWDVKLDSKTNQKDLIITPSYQPAVTVDDLEVAQFIYLLLNNEKVRDVIDAITSQAVLVLGRFSKERKPTLDALRDALREKQLAPIVFDFSIPAARDVTETIRTLAGIARFVLADVTDATEVRTELHNIVPDFPSLPVQPLLLTGKKEFVSLSGHLRKFPWLLPTFEYQDVRHLLENLDIVIKEPLERTAKVTIDRAR